MPRNVQGEAVEDYQDLVDRYGTLYRGEIFISRARNGRYQGQRGQFIPKEDVQRILQFNQLVRGGGAPPMLEDRPEPDRLEPTPTFYPDLIGPPWPGADARGPRTQWAEYDPELRRVTICFRNGDIYRYLDVPLPVWESLKNQASTGQYINHVLNGYPYQKIKSGR